MTPQEVSKVLHLAFPKLAEHCKDPKYVANLCTLCVNFGIKLGEDRILKSYNQMFRGYNKVSINN